MGQFATMVTLLLVIAASWQSGPALRNAESSHPAAKARAKIMSTPDAAGIWIDGKAVGATPAVVDLPAGDHVILLTKYGFKTWECAVRIGEKTSIKSFQGGSVSTADPDYGIRLGARLEKDNVK